MYEIILMGMRRYDDSMMLSDQTHDTISIQRYLKQRGNH
jgi:hypothetical protein